MPHHRFECFIGVDQTGALVRPGRCRPLPAAVFDVRSCVLTLVDRDEQALQLNHFSESEISRMVPRLSSELAIIVDCVFGLPAELLTCRFDLWNQVQGTHNFDYGLGGGAAFFQSLLGDRVPLSRICEQVAKANSLFRNKPAQKNIQTGTFRIWKDLARHSPRWFNLWPFDLRKIQPQRPWVFEAYPSLLWREVLGLKTRDLSALVKHFHRAAPGLTIKGRRLLAEPNYADAAVLALGAYLLQQRNALWDGYETSKKFRQILTTEGWILGLNSPTRQNSEKLRTPNKKTRLKK